MSMQTDQEHETTTAEPTQSGTLARRDGAPIERAEKRPQLAAQTAITALPMTSDDTDVLFAQLVKAQMAFAPVVKTRLAKIRPGFEYMFANLADVDEAVTPALRANGIIALQIPRGNRLVIRIVHGESGQWIEGGLPLVLPDYGGDMQRLGSALTYLRRYLLCTMLGVVAGDEDDDGGEARRTSGAQPKPGERGTPVRPGS